MCTEPIRIYLFSFFISCFFCKLGPANIILAGILVLTRTLFVKLYHSLKENDPYEDNYFSEQYFLKYLDPYACIQDY